MDKVLPPKQDRVFGCIVGGAVGDALGYPVEFKTWPAIANRYGQRGITRFELDERGLAQISDDTQMSLFTAAGVLLGMTRGRMRGVMGRIDGYCRFTYLDWLHTQEWSSKKQDTRIDSWLMDVPELYSRRAPGGTCLSALKAIENGKQVDNTSCGCGGVMRTAPIALISYIHGYSRFDSTKDDTLFVDDVAASAACITHKHPLGFIPSAVLNHLLMSIQSRDAHTRDDFVAIVQDAIEVLPHTLCQDDDDKPYGELWPKHVAIMRKLIRQALDLSCSDTPDQKAIASIGEGWTGHEALAIAVYCAVKHAESFEDAVISAVNHSGDSDSTGAICGNIIGCLLGRTAIPAHYTERLELLDVIEEMAQDLYTGCIISEYDLFDTPEKRLWYKKYCLHEWSPKRR